MCIVLFGTLAKTQKTIFLGTWILTDQKSISGNLYDNGIPQQIKVILKNDTIILEKTTAYPTGNIVGIEKIIFDEKPFETKSPAGRKVLITAKWMGNKNGFIAVSQFYNINDHKKLEITKNDIWSIEDNNLVLIRKNENLANGETWESKSIYKRKE